MGYGWQPRGLCITTLGTLTTAHTAPVTHPQPRWTQGGPAGGPDSPPSRLTVGGHPPPPCRRPDGTKRTPRGDPEWGLFRGFLSARATLNKNNRGLYREI